MPENLMSPEEFDQRMDARRATRQHRRWDWGSALVMTTGLALLTVVVFQIVWGVMS